MKREQEVLQAVVLPMVVVPGVKKVDAKRALKERLYFARPMGVAGGASTLDAQRVLKVALTSVLHTVAVRGAVMMDAPELQGGSLACASVMGVGRGVRFITAKGVQRVSWACASPMVVDAGVSIQHAQKVLRGAQCFVKLMVGAKDVRPQVVQKVLKGVHHFVRATVGGKGVHFKEARFVQGACMVEPCFVLHMVVVKGVLFPNAPKVLEGELLIVFVMVGAKGANILVVGRVHKAALIFARPMVEGNVAPGGKWEGWSLVTKLAPLAISLQEEKLASVLLIALVFMISTLKREVAFCVRVPHHRTQNLEL